MDLRSQNLSKEDIKQIHELIIQKKLRYQPFIFKDDLEVGEGKNFCDRYAAPGNVYWEKADPRVRDCLVEDLAYFRECNGKLRLIYEYFLDTIVANLGQDISELTFAEIGCNSGYFLHGLALRGAKRCIGYDMGDFQDVFNWFNRVLGVRNEFYFNEWDSLTHSLKPTELPVVDVILTAHVMLHLPDPVQHLAYLCDRAKKAIFILSFVNKHGELSISFGNPAKYSNELDWPLNFDNGVALSIPLLNMALKEAGFEKIIDVDFSYAQEIWNQDFGNQVFGLPIEAKACIAFRTKDIKTALSGVRKNRRLPSKLIGSHKGYNLVYHLNYFYAIPQLWESINLTQKKDNELSQFIRSQNQEEVKALIEAVLSKELEGSQSQLSKKTTSYSSEEENYYEYCQSHNIPYFGKIMWALQGLPLRHAYMQLVVKLECSDRFGEPFNILEVGTWAGGSAITWADAIKKFNNGRGFVICVDSWVPYFDSSQPITDLPKEDQSVYQEMTEALSRRKIYDLYEHNIRSSKHHDIVKAFKGFSDDILPLLGQERFNLVFIDGNHSYRSIAKDIKNAARLVTEGGILCGDDLELQISEIDVDHATKNGDMDYILDPKTNKRFHPGVSLAVGEFFGEVSAREGFWAMRKRGENWEKLELPDLDPDELTIPKHLTETARLQFQLQQTQAELEQVKFQLQQTQAELGLERWQILIQAYPNPILIENLCTYNIVAWKGNYYGLPQALGPVDLTLDDVTQLEGTFIEQSLSKLKECILKLQLDRSQFQVQQNQAESEHLQSQLQETHSQLQETQSQLQETQTDLNNSKSRIQAIESSKFWQLRQVWLHFKRAIRLTKES